MKGHIDTGTLAAYREGLLSRRQAARVAAHLPGCPQCAETDAQLAGVTTILAASQVPPMPAGLADRIQAALAAEAASRAADGASHATGAADGIEAGRLPLAGSAAGAGRDGSGNPPPSGPPREHRHRQRRSWLTLRVAAVTAAVAVIAGGGYGVAQILSGSTNTGGSSSSASGSPEHGVAGAGSGTGGASSQRLAPSAASMRHLNVVRSGTNYQPQQLASQAEAVLGRHAQPEPRPKAPGKNQLPGSFGSMATTLPACVQRVGGGHTPKLVDLASYQGQRAAVIMLPAAQHQVRVVVVGPGCSGTASDVLDHTVVPGSG